MLGGELTLKCCNSDVTLKAVSWSWLQSIMILKGKCPICGCEYEIKESWNL